jgi:cephalosporin hydroxylase
MANPRSIVGLLRDEAWVFRRIVYKTLFERRLKGNAVDEFTRVYYDGHLLGDTRADTHWLGVRTDKCPLDLWVYQELISRLRPDVIVETGTLDGGSALYFASICDLVGNGRVITIDIQEPPRPLEHERITFLNGSSTSPEIVARVREVAAGGTVMVVLDSDHRREHVLEEMRAYADLVSVGSYLIVEDTILNGHPINPEFGPGPMEAVEAFLAEDRRFEVDRGCEKLYLTFNRGGYLRRSR